MLPSGRGIKDIVHDGEHGTSHAAGSKRAMSEPIDGNINR
jgi:hypothetical protein